MSVAVGVLGLALAVWALVTGRVEGRNVERRDVKLLGSVFICAVFIGVALAARHAGVGVRSDGDGGRLVNPNGSAVPGAPGLPGRQQADLRWLPAVLIVGGGLALSAGVMVVRRRRRRPYAVRSDAELFDELAALLDDALDDLRAEPDPRRAVIAAYARTERALAGYGFPRRPFEAPLEYLDRIAAPLHERQPSARRLVFELTHLFERAKFSSHAVDGQMKEEAIRTLAMLRHELRAPEAA